MNTAHVEHHRSHRVGWLRAAVLGANDGLLSTSSLILGVASGAASRSTIMLTGIAALTAGSLSMAIGEYGSVASQRDAELADLAIERAAIDEDPDTEVAELAAIYRGRGLSSDLAERVAVELHAVDALGAHARDELGLDPDALARPLEAALVSAASFAVGSLIPVLAITTTSTAVRSWLTVVVTLICLFALGAVGAELGGARRLPAAVRVMSLGAVTMAVTAGVGHLVGAHL